MKQDKINQKGRRVREDEREQDDSQPSSMQAASCRWTITSAYRRMGEVCEREKRRSVSERTSFDEGEKETNEVGVKRSVESVVRVLGGTKEHRVSFAPEKQKRKRDSRRTFAISSIPEQKYFALCIALVDMTSSNRFVSEASIASNDFSRAPALDPSMVNPSRAALLTKPSIRRSTGASCRRRRACSGRLAATIVAAEKLARSMN